MEDSSLQSPISRFQRTLSLVVEYDGTDFQGFQRLSTGRTVQGTLETAWREITGEAARTIGAGRTDAGVHATGQVVSLRTEAAIPADRVALALNGRLPPDARVRGAREQDEAFHARFSARARTYRYVVRRRGKPSVFLDRYSVRVPGLLDVAKMREAARPLLGSHDFRSFGSPEPGRTAVREVRRITLRETGDWLIISLTANAFLRSMARCLVAQLLAAGQGQITTDDITERLRARDRKAAGKAAPPNGLYLARVHYKD